MSLKNKLDETKLRSLRYGDNEPRVDAPGITRTVMVGMADAIGQWVT